MTDTAPPEPTGTPADCPYYRGVGTCMGGMGCGVYGEPRCITDEPPGSWSAPEEGGTIRAREAPVSTIFDQVRDYTLSSPVAPTPGRIEVGTYVHTRIKGTMGSPAWTVPKIEDGLYGVKVVVNSELHPLEWRIYDEHGELVDGGAMELEAPR